MKIILSPYGVLSRKLYWKYLVILNLCFFGFIFLSIVILGLFDFASGSLASTIVFIYLLVMLIAGLYYTVFNIFLFLRRGRDAGSDMLLALVALFIPFGFIILGLIPSRYNK